MLLGPFTQVSVMDWPFFNTFQKSFESSFQKACRKDWSLSLTSHHGNAATSYVFAGQCGHGDGVVLCSSRMSSAHLPWPVTSTSDQYQWPQCRFNESAAAEGNSRDANVPTNECSGRIIPFYDMYIYYTIARGFLCEEINGLWGSRHCSASVIPSFYSTLIYSGIKDGV